MAKREFGHQNKLTFNSESDMYEVIGFLATSKRTSLTWERNEKSGAWGSEGRIHCKRINCNEFVKFLADSHDFQLNNSHSVERIRLTIPNVYLVDFERGVAI